MKTTTVNVKDLEDYFEFLQLESKLATILDSMARLSEVKLGLANEAKGVAYRLRAIAVKNRFKYQKKQVKEVLK